MCPVQSNVASTYTEPQNRQYWLIDGYFIEQPWIIANKVLVSVSSAEKGMQRAMQSANAKNVLHVIYLQ